MSDITINFEEARLKCPAFYREKCEWQVSYRGGVYDVRYAMCDQNTCPFHYWAELTMEKTFEALLSLALGGGSHE